MPTLAPTLFVGLLVLCAGVSGRRPLTDGEKQFLPATELRQAAWERLRLFNEGKLEHGGERIIAGKQSALGQFPWIVALTVDNTPVSQFCGGSVVSANEIVTAAHCFYGYEQDPAWVHAGLIDLRNPGANVQTLEVAEVHVSPYYHSFNMENDFCVLRLSGEFEFNSYVQPIDLLSPSLGLDTGGETAFVAGWGGIKAQGGSYGSPPQVYPDNMYYTQVPIISNDDCNEIYSRNYGGNLIFDSMVCATNTSCTAMPCQDGCQGDSGGPLVVNLGDGNTPYLAGTTSWGFGCGNPRSPGVYGRVSDGYEWYQTQLGSDSTSS